MQIFRTASIGLAGLLLLSACSQGDENATATSDAELAGEKDGMNYDAASQENAAAADAPVEQQVQDGAVPGVAPTPATDADTGAGTGS